MKSRKHIRIYKSHGGTENFSKRKLFRSLQRSGLPSSQCHRITDKVSRELYEGARTKDIYKRTLQLVKQSSSIAAVHYTLKKSLFELGPTGHHFETFVARYFEELGYETETCITKKGLLVSHEIDVIAKKDGKRFFVECKFHNRMGIKNDIKLALYVKARWDDLKQGSEGKALDGFYLASNTAFTTDAITYAKGTGLKLLGVNAPEERSFLEQIKENHLYPITSLRRLSKIIRNELLSRNILLAKDLIQQKPLLQKLGMSAEDYALLLEEIELLKESKK